MKDELGRVLRHGLPVLITYAIAKGWISPALQQPLLEFGAAAITFGLALVASRGAAKRKDKGGVT